MTCFISIEIFYLFFIFIFSVFIYYHLLCININMLIHQLLAGVGRALFHGSGEELGKMIRRASTLCPDNLVLL